MVSDDLVTAADGTISATGLTEGSYYFVETATVAPYAVDTQTRYAFSVTVDAAGTATAPIGQLRAQNYTQPSETTVTKQVNGGATAAASIGQTVTFTLPVQVPLDIADYTTFTVTDTVDARFSNVAVQPLAGSATSVTGNTVTATGDPAALAASAGQTVTLTITATVNNSTATGDAIPNTAEVTWNNGKGDSGTFDTNTVTVTLAEGSIAVTKVDGSTDAPLAGATFVLTDAAGNLLNDIDGVPYQATSAADGTLTFDRLPYGSYFVKETVAPDGYRLRTASDEVTVDATSSNVALTVDNYTTSTWLPQTGTWGALPWYVGGGLLIAAFALLMWRNRKADHSK